MDDLLTTREAATLLGVAPRTVRGYVARGVLPVARQVTPRLTLVRRADVERIRATAAASPADAATTRPPPADGPGRTS